MSQSFVETPRFRHTAAIILLFAAVVFVLVALSQLFIGVDTDPRDTIGSRAAGFGFTDRAHDTLFGFLPIVLPVLAVWLSDRAGVRLWAVVVYAAMIVTGGIIAGAAFSFGLDLAQIQTDAGITSPWIDERSAGEFLATDVAALLVMAVGLVAAFRAWRRVRPKSS